MVPYTSAQDNLILRFLSKMMTKPSSFSTHKSQTLQERNHSENIPFTIGSKKCKISWNKPDQGHEICLE